MATIPGFTFHLLMPISGKNSLQNQPPSCSLPLPETHHGIGGGSPPGRGGQPLLAETRIAAGETRQHRVRLPERIFVKIKAELTLYEDGARKVALFGLGPNRLHSSRATKSISVLNRPCCNVLTTMSEGQCVPGETPCLPRRIYPMDIHHLGSLLMGCNLQGVGGV
uniref:Uncharacterized protein n=1 Tax=Solanum lycopersicum TaxID=4081 RepID=A0A3Q7F318_SOLLC